MAELLSDSELAFNVAACLAKLPKDLDRQGRQRGGPTATACKTKLDRPAALSLPLCHASRVCGSLAMRPARSEAGIQRRISAFILLLEALAVLPPLAEALQGAQCELLRAVSAAAGHAAFAELRALLESALEEDAASAKNAFLNRRAEQPAEACCSCRCSRGASSCLPARPPAERTSPWHFGGTAPPCRTQQCFALKAGLDGFLDVARQAFCRVTEQARWCRLEVHAPLLEEHAPLPRERRLLWLANRRP